jgi:glyoxylase-like metal-dependent hydrolase (beta-lactamase superfamily II)
MSYAIHQLNGLGMESNSYLLLCMKPVLIDVGTGANLKATEKRLRAHLDGKKLPTLVLTHMHFDHTGGAAAIQEITGAQAFAHPPDSKALADGDGRLTCSGWLGEKQRPLRISELKDGAVLDCGDAKLEVLHTPGHSAGSICLLDRETGDLFSGDTVFANGGVGRWDLPTGDHDALIDSLARLLKLKIRGLYPGHGPYHEDDGHSHVEMGLAMARDFSD